MFKKFTSQDITSSLFICPYFYMLKIFRKKYGQVFTNQDCSQVYRPNILKLKVTTSLFTSRSICKLTNRWFCKLRSLQSIIFYKSNIYKFTNLSIFLDVPEGIFSGEGRSQPRSDAFGFRTFGCMSNL